MRYRLIIFDFDGTLADTFGWFTQNMNLAAVKFNFKKISPSEYDHLRSLETKEILKHLGVGWWKIPLIARYMRRLLASELSCVTLFDQVEQMLKELTSKNVTIAIVSSNSRDNVLGILGESAQFVSFFECGVSIFGKTSRFKKVLKKAKVSSHEVLCVGDEIRDIVAARRIRLIAGAVAWGYASAEALRGKAPDHYFQSIEEITDIFQ